MSIALQLLQRLAAARIAETDARRYVSGAALAQEFGITRSAIWKAIGTLRNEGTEIEAITHRGYRLALPSSPLDAAGVIAALSPGARSRLREGRCEGAIASTNTTLLERGAPPPGQFDFLTAELQSAGRGRRGRSWLAPPGGAICLSWSWSFEAMATQLGALSLATGVAALRALRSLGLDGAQLKWPNDLTTAHGKLGGILIEMRSEVGGPVQVVVGLGLNVALGAALRARILEAGNSPADLTELAAGGIPPSRNALVAALLEHGIAAFTEFGRAGLAPFLAEYRTADCLVDREVRIQGGNGPESGTARGIDTDGALKIEHDGRIHRIIAGEISVRTRET
jgi:BirA family transcriptional regulator, biotin operon repressor / biotin---[acetyl-CoA-carboxylase] ligase